MAPHTGRYSNDAKADRGRTLAQWYCLLAGAALLLLGLFGFLADAGFGVADDVPSGTVDGSLFLGFEVNGWHNLVHLASGAIGLAVMGSASGSRAYALGFGVVYGIVTLWGLIAGDNVLGLIPVNFADHLLHLGIAALGIGAGLASPAQRVAAAS